MTPGPRFSATISAFLIRRRAISLPSSVRTFISVLRILLLSSKKKKLSRFGLSAFHSRRARSPYGGRSILITSAPSQASICVQDGPAWSCVKSMTRMPSSAWLILILPMRLRWSCLRYPSSAQALALAFGHLPGDRHRQVLSHPGQREFRPDANQRIARLRGRGHSPLQRQRGGQKDMSREVSWTFPDQVARPGDVFRITPSSEMDVRHRHRGIDAHRPVVRAQPQRVLGAVDGLLVRSLIGGRTRRGREDGDGVRAGRERGRKWGGDSQPQWYEI